MSVIFLTPFLLWWFWPRDVSIAWANEIEENPSSVQLYVSACGPGVYDEYKVNFEETAERVNIHVYNGPRQFLMSPACADGFVVDLEAPIGDRALFDVVGEKFVVVEPGS